MNRFRSIAGRVLHILLAVMFAVQGFAKLAGSPGWISRFEAWGYPDQFYLVIGFVELAGAVLLLIPRLAGIGALLLIAVMVGATATHLVHGEPQVITTLVLMMLLLIILSIRRSVLTQLFGMFKKKE